MTHEIIAYKNAYLVVRKNVVDVIDVETNQWRTSGTIRSAKWNVSVWRRLRKEFSRAA